MRICDLFADSYSEHLFCIALSIIKRLSILFSSFLVIPALFWAVLCQSCYHILTEDKQSFDIFWGSFVVLFVYSLLTFSWSSLDDLWRVFGGSLEVLWTVFGRSLDGLWTVFGRSLDSLIIFFRLFWVFSGSFVDMLRVLGINTDKVEF